MLPSSLLFLALNIATQLWTTSAIRLAFTSQRQLELQDSLNAQDPTGYSFEPTESYQLPSSPKGLKTIPTTVYRPRSLEALHRNRIRSLLHRESDVDRVEWDATVVQGPDVEDMHTLAQLARMSGNAYALPGRRNWYDVDTAWNRSFPFGWEESDGFRGHVFLSSDNSTVILSIKGTTLQGPTSKLDKFNDNLLFSCCCARVDFSWVFRTVCDCYTGHWSCDNQCLTDALVQDSLFYSVGVKLVDNLRLIYPEANLWLVGHSLGGALASLLGATYGLPAVAFESPGERLAATRLHLPLPPPISVPVPVPPTTPPSKLPTGSWFSRLGWPPSHPPEPPIPAPSPPSPLPPRHIPISTTHVYHTADPIPLGDCVGFGSPCAQAGYALETRCHLGQSIIFDTEGELHWAVDVRRHVIKEIVHQVLEGGYWTSSDEEAAEGKQDPPRRMPKPVTEDDCSDCSKWEFGDFKDELKKYWNT